MLAIASLHGCASTDYQAWESTATITRQGAAATRKVVDGLDFWTFGAPPKKYRLLGVTLALS